MSSDDGRQFATVLTTSVVTFITGFLLGVWSIQGYLIGPTLKKERSGNMNDPLESDESDVDESDTILDHAPNWANGASADRRQGLRATTTPNASQQRSALNTNEECKLVLVVRTDLGMTKGKIAAQCSHATLACYKRLARASADSAERNMLARWEKYGQAKIAVQIKSQDELLELRKKAHNLGLTAEVIQDAGRTQIEAGSMTVLGVGPAPKSMVDQVTSHLKLL